MKRFALLALAAAGCTTPRAPLHAPLHILAEPLPQGQWALCLTPEGETAGWTSSATRQGERPYGTCAAPNHFVLLPVCGDGQVPADDASHVLPGQEQAWTAALNAARARLGRDGSLYGDSFEGRKFCAPLPPS
jgi:hypothetical protein